MLRMISAALIVALSLVYAAAAEPVPHKKKPLPKHPVTRHWNGYGFLPGYRPPEVIAAQRARAYWRSHPHYYYGPAWPGYYRGRWNGGGFGPCYTYTPIGYMWNCGP